MTPKAYATYPIDTMRPPASRQCLPNWLGNAASRLKQSSSGRLPSAIKINKNSHLYGKLYVCRDRRQSCPPGVNEGTVRPCYIISCGPVALI